MFKTIANALTVLGLLAAALTSLALPKRQVFERRNPEKARQDGDEMIHRRKGDDPGGED